VAVCSFCGAASSQHLDSGAAAAAAEHIDDGLPLTWATSDENDKRRVYCERCSREHLRSIESKLDSEWW
jgi:hypothetical protein